MPASTLLTAPSPFAPSSLPERESLNSYHSYKTVALRSDHWTRAQTI